MDTTLAIIILVAIMYLIIIIGAIIFIVSRKRGAFKQTIDAMTIERENTLKEMKEQ